MTGDETTDGTGARDARRDRSIAALRAMVEEVEADMASLRAQVEAIEEYLAARREEVRTRRLVLTDEDDRPAVVVEAAGDAVEVRFAAALRVVPLPGTTDEQQT